MYLVEFIANACVCSVKCKNYSYFHFDKQSRLLFSIKQERASEQKKKRRKTHEKPCQIHMLLALSVKKRAAAATLFPFINSAATMLSSFRFEWFALQFIAKFPCDLSSSRHKFIFVIAGAFVLLRSSSRANELAPKWKWNCECSLQLHGAMHSHHLPSSEYHGVGS